MLKVQSHFHLDQSFKNLLQCNQSLQPTLSSWLRTLKMLKKLMYPDRASHHILAIQVYQILQLTLSHVGVLVCSTEQKSHFRLVVDILNFLAKLYQEGHSYTSLNTYESAIFSVHEYIKGIPNRQHSQVLFILKRAYNLHPPTPRYSNTQKVSTAVAWLGYLTQNYHLLS